MSSIKLYLKRIIGSNALLALWVARIYYHVLAVPAFLYRLRFYLINFVPFSVKIIGIRRVQLGSNTVIGSRTWLNVNDRKGVGVALSIGNNCFIGQDNFFTVGNSIIIRDYCLTAKGCAFIGSAHVYDDPMIPYTASGVTSNHDIYIGSNCFFGLDAKVIGNVSIGHGCVIGSGAVVRKDVPPFSLVVGDPAVVIKRFDFAEKKWVKWPQDKYCEGPVEAVYLTELRQSAGFLIQPISAAAGNFYDLM